MAAPLGLRRLQHVYHVLEMLVLEQPANQFRAGILFPFEPVRPRQKHLRLDPDQRRRHLEELPRPFQRHAVESPLDRSKKLSGDVCDGDVQDVDVLRSNQVKQEIQWPLETVQLHDEGLSADSDRRPGLGFRGAGNHLESAS